MSAVHRHVGGSLLPSNNHFILQPMKTSSGWMQVRVIEEEDSHGLYLIDGARLLAKHPNGFSCHCLAERISSGWRAAAQAEYIVACGGQVTDAGWEIINKEAAQ